ARPARGREQTPEGGIRREDITVALAESNDRIFAGQDDAVRVDGAHDEVSRLVCAATAPPRRQRATPPRWRRSAPVYRCGGPLRALSRLRADHGSALWFQPARFRRSMRRAPPPRPPFPGRPGNSPASPRAP